MRFVNDFDLEKYRSIGGFVRGTQKFEKNGKAARADYPAQCREIKDPDSPIAQMVKDKVMFRHIKGGGASDKALKKDAEVLEKTYTKKKKEESKRERFKPVQAALEKYKRRYKQNPI